MFSVLKFDTIELMKFSRITTARIDFQSVAVSPRSRQIDSRASLTMAGGLAIDLTSTSCCFLISFTAVYHMQNNIYIHIATSTNYPVTRVEILNYSRFLIN